MTRRHTPLAVALALVLASPLAAQEAGWDGEAEVGASVLFGAQDQSLVTARLDFGHADSTWDVGSTSSFVHGRSDDESGESRLTHRSWAVEATADYLPFARVSYFGLAGLESSLQRRIDLRSTGGAGIKYTWIRTESALLDAGLALLAERTAFDPGDDGVTPDDETLARWSAGVRAKRVVGDDRLVLESATLWGPVFDELDRYVVETAHSAAYRVTESVALKLSLIDVYDSEAEDRGAASNHDGRFLFSVLGSF
jgi:hypothetical protein